jgi:hypothetical protein
MQKASISPSLHDTGVERGKLMLGLGFDLRLGLGLGLVLVAIT